MAKRDDEVSRRAIIGGALAGGALAAAGSQSSLVHHGLADSLRRLGEALPNGVAGGPEEGATLADHSCTGLCAMQASCSGTYNRGNPCPSLTGSCPSQDPPFCQGRTTVCPAGFETGPGGPGGPDCGTESCWGTFTCPMDSCGSQECTTDTCTMQECGDTQICITDSCAENECSAHACETNSCTDTHSCTDVYATSCVLDVVCSPKEGGTTEPPGGFVRLNPELDRLREALRVARASSRLRFDFA